MQNKSINKIDIDENKLLSLNFESIVTLEELLTYFYDPKLKLKKNNYISFFKIFNFYQMNTSLNFIFIKEKKFINIFEKLFKLQLLSILLDEFFSLENKSNEEKYMMKIKYCLSLNHQNFLILSLIIVEILQFHNMTNLYFNKINKIIYEKLEDHKLYNPKDILNIKDLASKIVKNNMDIENKIKLFKEEKKINNVQLFDLYNKLNEIKIEEFINCSLRILGLKDKEISEINNSYSLNKSNVLKSVKVPFLKPYNDGRNYKITIILDLDETLLYSEEEEEINEEEEEEEEEEKGQQNNIILRPGIFEFLDKLSNLKIELIIFTSSVMKRADELINIIEKNKKYFDKRLYREYCTLLGAAYIKDISKLGRDLTKTIIIDNDLTCFYLQQENGILIKSFKGEKDDNKLLNLYQILEKIIKSPFNDIRFELDKYRKELIEKVAS